VRGGLSGVQVPILSSIPSVGDIIGSPLVFNGGVSSVSSAQFDPLTLGSTTVSVEAPVGFSTPSTLRTRTFNVTSPVINMSTVTVGKDLEVNVGAALGAPAPSYPLQVTITSSDPSKLILSTSATSAGASSIDLTVNSGTVLPTFYAQALAGDGSVVQMMASAPGYATSSANVTLRPSGFIIQFPSGDPVSTTTLSANTVLVVACGPLAQTTLAWAGLGAQAVRGGLSGVQVPILSSIPSVGDIIGSPLVFNGGVSSVSSAQFDPVALGSTLVSVEAPVGFSTPSNLRTRTFNVTAPVISFVPRGLPREAGRMSVRDAG